MNIRTPSLPQGYKKGLGKGLSTIKKTSLAIGAALALSGCDDTKVDIGPVTTTPNTIERPIYTEKRAQITYKSNDNNHIAPKIKDIEITLPSGDYQVSILHLKLSGNDGRDSIKGAETIFSQAYHSTGGEGPIPIKIQQFGAYQSLMIISGENLQQTILFNAKEEIYYSTNSSQTQ